MFPVDLTSVHNHAGEVMVTEGSLALPSPPEDRRLTLTRTLFGVAELRNWKWRGALVTYTDWTGGSCPELTLI